MAHPLEATGNNLQSLDAAIPVGLFTCVTGVSGSGKSTLIQDTLYPRLLYELYGTRTTWAPHLSLEGTEQFDKVIDIDQSPIGRTPRSNPATYTGTFDMVRELFAMTPDAKIRGYKNGRFSFNVKGGRCEACKGDGIIKIEMHFLPDVYVPCEVCKGRRYNRPASTIRGMAKHPLSEVFGFPPDDQSAEAVRHRKNRLCPFNNKVPNCTKDKAEDPLGVCSVREDDHAVITCPIRFREDWHIADEAADFFFPAGAKWTSLTEVRLNDKNGKSAGNIDVVLVSYDKEGAITDFGALEVQAVYISGNVRRPFNRYMQDPVKNANMDWSKETNYPRPDFLSSSRKRLAPQLLFKGGILHAWKKKMAVALDESFFETLPKLEAVKKEEADMAWLVYDLKQSGKRLKLTRSRIVYTKFSEALEAITRPEIGDAAEFLKVLQAKLDEKLDNGSAPETTTIQMPGP